MSEDEKRERPKGGRKKDAGKLAKASADIRSDLPSDLDFQYTVFCQTYLPYRKMEERLWFRRLGDVSLEVEAGRVINPDNSGEFMDMPLPYGEKPRLLMIHLNSEAKRTRSPVIEVEGSMTAFIAKLGMDTSGPAIRRFKHQLASLACSRIRFGLRSNGRMTQVNTQVISKFDLWFPKNESQKTLWPSQVKLSQEYYDSLDLHAVPLDARAVAALTGSSMALDIYCWLAQRLTRVPFNKDRVITWAAVHAQFGLEYKEIRFFRRDFLTALKKVLAVYPDARLDVTEVGLTLRNSPSPVPAIQVRGLTLPECSPPNMN